MYRNKHISLLVLFFSLWVTGVSGQKTTINSPFSMKGLGNFVSPVLTRATAMGGISLAMRDSRYIDFNNPASYSARDTLSFVFNFGVKGLSNNIKSSTSTVKTNDMNLANLVFSFPVAPHVGVAMGFVPSVITGYTLSEQVTEDDPLYNQDVGALQYNFQGSGGVTRFFLGGAVDLFKEHLSLGVNFDYYFGKIQKTHELFFPDNLTTFNTRLERNYIVSDFNFDLGLQYIAHFGEEKQLVIGLTGSTTHKKVNYTEEAYDYAVIIFPNGNQQLDTVNEYTLYNRKILMPPTLGIGFTFSNGQRWTVGADYSYSNWSKADIPFNNDSLIPSHALHAGFEYSPNPRDLRKYWKIIKYRIGGHYQSSYYTVGNNPVDDFGISFGVGLPIINRASGLALMMGRTTFNISLESGWRGDIKKNFVQEQYNIIKFGISVNDLWFIKRRYQ